MKDLLQFEPENLEEQDVANYLHAATGAAGTAADKHQQQ